MIRILNRIKTLIDLPLIALNSDKLQEQIIYNISPFSDNGAVSQYKLELNIVCKTLAKCEEVDKAIRDGLLNYGDIKKIGVLSIALNGGGTLTSEKYVHRICTYSIKIKNDN